MTTEGPVHRPQTMFRSTLGQASRWPIVGMLALVSLILGYIGWAQYYGARPESASVWDTLYLDVQLFFLQSGAVPGPLPVTLEVARFLAFMVAAVAAIKGIAALARDQVGSLRRRLARGHTVIVGLGDKGRLLAEEFLASGTKVVAVEADATNDSIPELAALGANVFVGDGTDPATLADAGVARAAHLIALTGDDETNAEIATRARFLVAERTGVGLTCVAHIVDPDLSELLRLEELASTRTDQFRLDFFNVAEAGARVVLERVPPERASDDPSVVVAGEGRLARQIAAQARRRLAGRGAVAMVSVPDDPDARVDALGDASGIDVVYVCPDDERTAFTAALALRATLSDRNTRVVAVLQRFGGLAGLLDRSGARSQRGALDAIAVLSDTCRPGVVLGGTIEALARAIHDQYIRTRARDGVAAGAEPSTQPWVSLSDALRESNRDQAAHVGAKLSTVRCALAPARTGTDSSEFTFTADEVELLAIMEHDRWVAERRRNGWTYDPSERDVAATTTPHLVAWEHLGEETRDYDRVVITELPRLIARAGFRIIRLDETPLDKPGP